MMQSYGNNHYARINGLGDACQVLIDEATKEAGIPLVNSSIDYKEFTIKIERNEQRNDNNNTTEQTTE